MVFNTIKNQYNHLSAYTENLVSVLILLSKDTYKEHINEIKEQLSLLPQNQYIIACEYIKTNFTFEIEKNIFERIMLAFLIPYSYDFKTIFLYIQVKGTKEILYNYILWFSDNLNNYCFYTKNDFINEVKYYFSEVDKSALKNKNIHDKLMYCNNEIIKNTLCEISDKKISFKNLAIDLVEQIKHHNSIDNGLTWFIVLRNALILVLLISFGVYLFIQVVFFGNTTYLIIAFILLAGFILFLRHLPH